MNKRWQLATGIIFCLLCAGIIMPSNSMAVDLTECMTRKVLQASESMTIGDLRLECEKEINDGTYTVQENETEVISERMKQDKEHVLQPFTLMSHKPNYILLGAYNSTGYNAEVYREGHNDPSIEVDDTEAQFQVSIKTPLAVNERGNWALSFKPWYRNSRG